MRRLSRLSRKALCVRRTASTAKVSRLSMPDRMAPRPLEPYQSAKYSNLVKKIQALDAADLAKEKTLFKHFIYTDLRESAYGAKAIGSFLKEAGFTFLMKRGSSGAVLDLGAGPNGFALLQSLPLFGKPLTVKTRREVLKVFNERPGNTHGDLLRIVVLDSKFKEGIDLFDVKYVHIMEPPIAASDLTQAVGRATRFCGQRGLKFQLGWPLHVYVYDTELPGREPFLLQDQHAQKISAHEIVLRESGLDLSEFAFSSELMNLGKQTAVDADLTAAFHSSAENSEKQSDKQSDSKQSDNKQSDKQSGGGAFWKIKPVLKSSEIKGAKLRKCSTRKTGLFPFTKPHLYRIAKQMGFSVTRATGRDVYCTLLAENQQYLNMMFRTTDLTTPPKKNKKNNTRKVLRKGPTLTLSGTFDEFQSRILHDFGQFAWKKKPLKNECDTPVPPVPTYTPTQDFIQNYFTPASPFKGLLAWHSVGTGKTCLAIAAAHSFEAAGYSILWVTRNSLIPDVAKNLWDTVCHVGLRARIASGKSLPKDEASRRKLLPHWYTPISYRTFQNATQGRNELGRALKRKNGADPLKKTLLIMDEVHKLQDGDLGPAEAADFYTIQAAIHRSYELSGEDSVRPLLMTATPISKGGKDLLELLNTLIPNIADRLPVVDFRRDYTEADGTITEEGVELFQDKAKGLISYLNREHDASTFAQPVFETVTVPVSETPEETAVSIAEQLIDESESRAFQTVVECEPVVKGLSKEKRSELQACRKTRDATKKLNSKLIAASKKTYTRKRKAFLASASSQMNELLGCMTKSKPTFPGWPAVKDVLDKRFLKGDLAEHSNIDTTGGTA